MFVCCCVDFGLLVWFGRLTLFVCLIWLCFGLLIFGVCLVGLVVYVVLPLLSFECLCFI